MNYFSRATYGSAIFLLLFSSSYGQLDLSTYSINNSTTTFTGGNKVFYLETTPWVVKGGWYQYFFSTLFTAVWSSPTSLAVDGNVTIPVTNDYSTGYGPAWILAGGDWWGNYTDPNYLNSPSYVYNYEWNNQHWRRNYNGVFSAHVLYNAPTNQNILFAVSHGENKNEKAGSYFYQNSVNPSKLINTNDPSTYSGYQGGVYVDDGDAYHAFVNGNWITYDAAHDWGAVYLNDLGPIVWPSAGYWNANGTHASYGVRQPSSIVYNGYLYIYVIDNSFNGNGGVKLVRCPVNNVMDPASYTTWSAASGWVPSLPPGFTKENIAAYFTVPGPQNTSVFPDADNTIRFAVAQFNNTNNFIGVEWYMVSNYTTPVVALRYSSDLINWTDRVTIYSQPDMSSFNMHYPIFLSKDGTSNTAIDQDDFYVLGVTTDNHVLNKMHFFITPPPPPPPPPCGSPGADPCPEPCPGDPNSMCITVAGRKVVVSGPGTILDDQHFASGISPNPAKGIFQLSYALKKNARVGVRVLDATGRPVLAAVPVMKEAGHYMESIDVSSGSRGIYLVELSVDGMKRTYKAIYD